ncbi:hypothetical protein LINPERHAP1_LOCUS4211 [Linum perenne]
MVFLFNYLMVPKSTLFVKARFIIVLL